jgi:glycerol-3-phosphate dehydrogenase
MAGKSMYDVIVIGGGVTGTGTARDCAMRGLNTLLVDKRDFCGGTTGTCMGMIHGGLRYLLHDVDTTRISCIDSGYIQRIAPHLLFRIPFLTIVTKDSSFPIDFYETYMEAYDRFVHLKGGKKHTRLSRDEVLEIEPGVSPNIVGAVTTDEWGINPFRLCAVNALSASEHGADVRNHCLVREFLKDSAGNVQGVAVENTLTGEVSEETARITFIAAGPWTPALAARAGVEVRMRPAKGINIFLDRRITNYAVVAMAVDGRQVVAMPYENATMIGCTDDDYYGDLDNVTATNDEVEYLLQALERVFPTIRQARIMRVMAGVRPTLYEWKPYEDDLSREYEIYDHKNLHGVDGLLSIAGGKLAMYRLMAEHATDAVCRKLGVDVACRTHEEPLPGGDEAVDEDAVADEYNAPRYVVRRLAYRHGSRCRRILDMIREDPALGALVCRCEPVTEAEIRYVIRHEMARTLDDLRRRTRVGSGPCQGARCNFLAAAILADELNLAPGQALAASAEFLQQRWKGKAPILRGDNLAQEELNQAIYNLAGNYPEVAL